MSRNGRLKRDWQHIKGNCADRDVIDLPEIWDIDESEIGRAVKSAN